MNRLIYTLLSLFISGCQTPPKESPPPVIEGYWVTENDHVYYKTIGYGDTIVVLHGGPGMGHEYLLPTLEKLGTHYKVVFYDQKGGGRSLTSQLTYARIGLEPSVWMLEELRKYLILGNITLIGHSSGALLAAHYAMQYPDSVRKLILLNPVPFTRKYYQEFESTAALRLKTINPTLNRIRQTKAFQSNDPQAVSEYFRELFKAYVFDSQDVEKLNFGFSSASAIAFWKVMELFGENIFRQKFNFLPELTEKLKTPTLVIHGDYDPIPAASSKAITDAIQGAKLKVIKNCGHFPNIEKSEELINILYDFLETPNRPAPTPKPVAKAKKKEDEKEKDGDVLKTLLKVMITGIPNLGQGQGQNQGSPKEEKKP